MNLNTLKNEKLSKDYKKDIFNLINPTLIHSLSDFNI